MRALQQIAIYDQSISLYSCMNLLQKLGKGNFSQDTKISKRFITLGLIQVKKHFVKIKIFLHHKIFQIFYT